jgi:hypothetical protein
MFPRLRPSTTFALNSLLIVLLGVSISIWLLHYTTFLPEVAALLSLGGAFTWITLVSRVLPKSRMEELQNTIEHSVFMKPRTLVILLPLILVCAIFATFLGTVKISPGTESANHRVRFRSPGATWSEAQEVVPHAAVKEVFWTTLFSDRHVEVKVSGYPAHLVTVKPWRISELYVPHSFLQQVILLRPTVRLAAHGHDGLQLVVTINGKQYHQDFQGQSVWVGCDEDVLIPGWLQDSWRADLNSSPLAASWLHPKSISSDLLLEGTQSIDVELRAPATNAQFSSMHVPVMQIRSIYDFPQEVILDVPKKENPDDASP